MTSDSAYKIPTQQSVKAYVDSEVTPKIYLTGEIANVSAGASSWTVPPVAGTISKIYTVIDGAIITVDAGISFELGGTAITDGGITIAFTASAALINPWMPINCKC
jgi:hypothetical protein